MNLKKITLNDFKSFKGTLSFTLDKINLIQGNNGTGKSTLIKDSILFALYGYSEQTLERLPTKGKTSCSSSLLFDFIEVQRTYPTSIKIFKEFEVDLVNNNEKQKYLNDIFKTVDYFRRFRMIDSQSGINILEEGNIALKKILFSIDEHVLTRARTSIALKKAKAEIYNRDNIVTYSHYPSQKRMDMLNIGITDTKERIDRLVKDIESIEKGLFELNQNKTKSETSLEYYRKQKDKIVVDSECPTCFKRLNADSKIEMLRSLYSNIETLNERINGVLSEINDQKDILSHLKHLRESLFMKEDVISRFIFQLSNRLKQKDFIYTTNDVELYKKAIKELDNFSSFYLVEKTKILEPIINDILDKIGFSIKFTYNEGKFDLKLYSDEEYTYKDLSTGQRLVLLIAFKMALLLERGESGLIIADEGMSALDNNNLKWVIELFKNLPFQLLCVVHGRDLSDSEINVINL
jgi:DNA repair exonuclease SbcCD ATPase subunit